MINTLVANSVKETLTYNNNSNDTIDSLVYLQTGIINSVSSIDSNVFTFQFSKEDSVLQISNYVSNDSKNVSLNITELEQIFNEDSANSFKNNNPNALLNIDNNNYVVIIRKMTLTEYEIELLENYTETEKKYLKNFKGTYSLYIDTNFDVSGIYVKVRYDNRNKNVNITLTKKFPTVEARSYYDQKARKWSVHNVITPKDRKLPTIVPINKFDIKFKNRTHFNLTSETRKSMDQTTIDKIEEYVGDLIDNRVNKDPINEKEDVLGYSLAFDTLFNFFIKTDFIHISYSPITTPEIYIADNNITTQSSITLRSFDKKVLYLQYISNNNNDIINKKITLYDGNQYDLDRINRDINPLVYAFNYIYNKDIKDVSPSLSKYFFYTSRDGYLNTLLYYEFIYLNSNENVTEFEIYKNNTPSNAKVVVNFNNDNITLSLK